MEKSKRIIGAIFSAFIATLLLLSSSLLISCNDYAEFNGTYYYYENAYDKSNYVTLENGNWSDDNGDGGTYEINDGVIVFYAEFDGEKEELFSGAIGNGVMQLAILGENLVYAQENVDVDNIPKPQKKKYTVIFDANGGSFANGETTITQSDVPSKSLLTAPQSPTKKNCKFSGWSSSKMGLGVWNFATDTVSADTTLYAIWQQDVATIFSVEGASINGKEIFMLVDKTVDSVSLSDKLVCDDGSVWKLYYDKLGQTEIPTKIATGTFGELADGDNLFYIVVTSSDGTQVNVYELTVHRSYKIYVYYYDGEQLLHSAESYTGKEFTADYAPTITGYTFNGWKLGSYTFSADVLWDNLVLKAVKTPKTYTVTLDENGGEELADNQKTLTYDSAYTLAVPKKTGYSFLGWYLGSTQLTDSKGKSLDVWNIDSNKTLKAKWQANEYTLTLNKNYDEAGTVTGAGSYLYDSKVTIKATTNLGYNWLGWYDKNGELVSAETSYTFKMGFSTTFTAKWDYYTVTTETNIAKAGTYTAKTEEKISTGKTVSLTAKSNLGYDWLGWYKGDELLSTDLTYSFKMGAENLNLTAKWALDEQTTNFTFTSTPTSLTITGLNDSTVTQIVIPDYATKIADSAFKNCNNLTSVEIGDSVTSIGNSAFEYCSSLTSVEIGDSVKSIGSYAFRGCSSLTSVVIGDSVESIGYQAFQNCSSLTEITLPFVGATKNGTENTHFGYIFGASRHGYNDDYVPTSLKKVTITSATSIGHYAFHGCSNLTSVVIPDSVTSIGYEAFYGCTSLTSVIIGDSVTSIGYQAFSGCYRLVEVVNKSTHITVTKGNTSNGYVGYYALAVYNSGDEFTTKLSTDNGFIVYTDGEDKLLVGYTGRETDITIPSDITKINQSAFYNCSSLTSVEIGDSVTSIDEDAFLDCNGLTSVIIGDSVTSIGSSAFASCRSLASVEIPNSVTSVGSSAFYNCSSLTSVYISDLKAWCNISFGNSYANPLNYANNLYLNNEPVTNLIPDSVTSIGDYAFYNCTSLASVTIPNSVTSVGSYAFAHCSSLTSVEIGDSVTSIGSSAFYNCSSLTSVTIPDSVTSIGDSAFGGCSSLESITIPFVGKERKTATDTYQYPFGYIFGTSSYTGGKGVKQYYYGSSTSSTTSSTYYIPTSLKKVTVTGGNILYGAFYNCSGLTSVEIPDSVTSIGDHAFYVCSSLTSIEIPDGVTSIGSSAFASCSSLASVEIPYNTTHIGNSAFEYCSSLTSITIPDSVTSIGNYAFYNCSSLAEIALPFVGASKNATGYQAVFGYIFGYTTSSSSSTISGATYQYWDYDDDDYYYYHYYIPTSLKKVTITGGNIPYHAFYNCRSLTSVEIGNSVTSIGSSAFYNCIKLTNVEIGDSVTSIGSSAFEYCWSLTSVTIPDSVTSIGSSAFEYCSSLTSITIPDSVTSIGDAAFFYCDSLTSVVIGDSVTSIGSSAFYNCIKLTNVEIGDSVTSIGSSAFNKCNSLTSVEIGDSVTSIRDYAFSGCSSLTSITIPDSVTSIGDHAFSDCSSLTSVEIGDSVTSIGDYAFSDCSSLTSVVIGDGVTIIGEAAFRDCSSLTSVVIGDGVTSIGNGAFYNCSSLTSVYYKGTASEWSGIWIGSSNTSLTNATRYYYSEAQPTASGNYWHYDEDGNVAVW